MAMTPGEQFQALNTMDYLSDLFSAGEKETFSRAEILVILDLVRRDTDMFDPDVVVAQQKATADIDSGEMA